MFILPINRDNDVVEPPRVVIALMIANCFVLIATYAFSSPTAVFKLYGFIPAQPHFSTIFTSMFIHVGFWHLAGNLWFLWMFGKEVEHSFGPLLFGLVYFLCGAGGALLHFIFNHGSTIPCGGASGAISGVAGCFFILFPKADFDLVIFIGWIRLKTIPSHTKAAIGTWIGEQAVLGLLSETVHFSSTAFWAHIGGFATGLVAALCFKELVPLDEDGLPVVRRWFNRTSQAKERQDLTQLNLR